ncbi:MAG: AbrB/MazE/SpoVT family DNA-binding domain-containing protein [Alphaproteobacteria bacterium]|nr:AbrB/MazE/SpoVT family DNA-binding domain-containing protein [Alphaproteobacteria bacterium]MBM3950896.1 AbrB/MazE/SpoVT family DNA-binding domain-containing protein [Rhodospirillales bacterium]
MNVQAKVTVKGQVTIPVKVRELLGVKDGGPVVFHTEGETVTLVSAKKPTLTELLAGFDPARHRHAPEERGWDDAPVGREKL